MFLKTIPETKKPPTFLRKLKAGEELKFNAKYKLQIANSM